MAEGIEFYSDGDHWITTNQMDYDLKEVRQDNSIVDGFAVGGKLAREIQKETAKIVERLRGGDNE